MSQYAQLQEQVCRANRALGASGLVLLTWGNASGVDRAAGAMAIKPSGVGYAELRPEDIVVVALDDGRVLEGRMRPSSDTPTHRHLYLAFPRIGGVVHTHSKEATAWAQAGLDLPCLGTTHADHFRGAVPVTRALSAARIAGDYERETGRAIEECFAARRLDPCDVPAVLVRGHGPFAWGPTAAAAIENAIVLEAVAGMARWTWALGEGRGLLAAPGRARPLPRALVERHFGRKHGPGAYYGQPRG